MITGATGCGKSSTINAMFDTEVAKVGVDSETMEIEKYELDNLVLWETPGLGDGKEADMAMKGRHWDEKRKRGYNVEKLLDMVIDNMPKERRSLVA